MKISEEFLEAIKKSLGKTLRQKELGTSIRSVYFAMAFL